MTQVASAKFTISLELLQNGYNFVFLDGDVCLTGSRDPFADMLPLTNHTWEVQFQKDFDYPNTEINIGWFFARASQATKDYFQRSYDQWLETHDWDQSVMNDLASQMEADWSLKVHRLDLSRFCNFMLEEWEEMLFGAEHRAAKFVEDSALVHYTRVEQSVKTYFGANFGGFTDQDGFYSKPPRLLGTANIAGTSDAILQQTAFALELAQRTHRTLIWPNRVSIIQRRNNEETEERQFYGRFNFPGVRVVSHARAKKAGINSVEGRYVQNQRLWSLMSTKSLEEFIGTFDRHIVPILNFDSFMPAAHSWLRAEDLLEPFVNLTSPEYEAYFDEAVAMYESISESSGVELYARQMQKKLHLCQNADYDFECLAVCNDG